MRTALTLSLLAAAAVAAQTTVVVKEASGEAAVVGAIALSAVKFKR